MFSLLKIIAKYIIKIFFNNIQNIGLAIISQIAMISQ